MSLKRYLFISIALFVLLLAGGQLVFVHYIQQQIANEVEAKSRALSKQAVDVLVENLVVVNKQKPAVSRPSGVFIEIKSTPNKIITLDNKNQFVTGNQTQSITVKGFPETARTQVKEKLLDDLHELKIAPMDNNYAFSVGLDKQNIRHQQIVQFSKQDSAINKYINWLYFVILALSTVGLVFAYWLARYISRPLAALSNGFKHLEDGHLGTQIEPKGIAEIKNTLQRFNHMSAQLSQLNELEKRYQQQQQLAELGEVSRGLAHTLRNPINTIGLALEQMAQQDITDEQRQLISIQVRHKIIHLDNTIKALLSLTANGIDREQDVNIEAVIADIIMELSMSASHKIEFSTTQKMIVKGAESEIRAMIHTLVVNACEASDINQSISIFCQGNHKCIQIIVVDQGRGLLPHIKEAIFKPHISSKPEGAGMGLYIAKRISQTYYQGNVELKDNQPQGCIATLTLCTANQEGATAGG